MSREGVRMERVHGLCQGDRVHAASSPLVSVRSHSHFHSLAAFLLWNLITHDESIQIEYFRNTDREYHIYSYLTLPCLVLPLYGGFKGRGWTAHHETHLLYT
jgi:hypothetical protein